MKDSPLAHLPRRSFYVAEPVSTANKRAPANKPANTKPSKDRRAYMRELMRKKRAVQK